MLCYLSLFLVFFNILSFTLAPSSLEVKAHWSQLRWQKYEESLEPQSVFSLNLKKSFWVWEKVCNFVPVNGMGLATIRCLTTRETHAASRFCIYPIKIIALKNRRPNMNDRREKGRNRDESSHTFLRLISYSSPIYLINNSSSSHIHPIGI